MSSFVSREEALAEGALNYDFHVRLSERDLCALSREQIDALMGGLAAVFGASGTQVSPQ